MNEHVNLLMSSATRWPDELKLLRSLCLECGLIEEYKWKQPCYTYQTKNILIIGSFKAHCTLSFLKGVLLQDKDKLLAAPGENSNHVRMFQFTSPSEIIKHRDLIKAYIYEAMDIEKAGLKVDKPKSKSEVYPQELEDYFVEKPELRTAFIKLTPGRQRGYILHIEGAKQSATKTDRIVKYEKRILDGYGIHDCTCGHTKRKPTCDGSHKYL